MATTSQIKMIRTILSMHGITEQDEKERVVLEFTDQRTSSISNMTHSECNQMVTTYQGDGGRQRMINKMLSLAHEMGWELPGTDKVDMSRVNRWCRNYSPAHVELDQIKTHELGKVVSIFEKVYDSFLKGI